MANDEFKPTDVFDHRYQNPKVLTEYLTKTLHFKLEQIKMRTTKEKGIQVQLPRPLTKDEREEVFRKFDEANEEEKESNEDK
ncbi:hypothetical protein MGN70_010040 [Eutypa lata]|nr:hypothetical protein MGN70_010040 [Eutypa lata]